MWLNIPEYSRNYGEQKEIDQKKCVCVCMCVFLEMHVIRITAVVIIRISF